MLMTTGEEFLVSGRASVGVQNNGASDGHVAARHLVRRCSVMPAATRRQALDAAIADIGAWLTGSSSPTDRGFSCRHGVLWVRDLAYEALSFLPSERVQQLSEIDEVRQTFMAACERTVAQTPAA